MKFWLYKAFLFALRALIYLKRALFWLGKQVLLGISALGRAYQATLGFWLYKFWFSFKRKLEKHRIPLDSRLVELLGKRSTLQVLLFCMLLLLLYPSSKLYTAEVTTLPGQKSVLYAMVGPGDLDYDIGSELIVVEQSAGVPPVDAPAWKEGAVAVNTPGTAGKERQTGPKEISSVSAGGTALTKPTILPGAELPEFEENVPSADLAPSARNGVVQYTVQPGDVLGGIASQFGVSINTILWANDLTIRSYIRPGDVLNILPVEGLVHTVQRGDTVGGIASYYDADPAQIIAYNNLQSDGRDIVIGEDLIVPEGTKPAPRPTLVQRVVNSAPVVSTPLRSVAAPPPSVEAPAGSGFVWPAGVRYISQYYGWRHAALDIAGPVGTPIYATKGGTVSRAICSGWNYGFGCYLMIDHGGGVQSLYAHNSQLYVNVGDVVSQGQTVALMGSTGNSSGPHVHFEVRVNGARQNPLQYVR